MNDEPRSAADIVPDNGWPAPSDPSPGWKIDPADRKRNRYWDGGDWGGESITPVELMKRKRQASEGDKPQVVVNNRGCGSGCAGTFAVFLVIGLIAMVLEKC